MIRIPDEVVKAAKATYAAEIHKGNATAREYDAAMRASLAAALSAWPGATYAKWRDYGQADRLILPLPQEPTL